VNDVTSEPARVLRASWSIVRDAVGFVGDIDLLMLVRRATYGTL
jgi:hypothetical protein